MPSKLRSVNLAILAIVGISFFCLWQTTQAQAKLTKVSPKAHASKLYPTSNVYMSYYKSYPDGNMVNYTKAFDAASNSYQFNWTSGALKPDIGVQGVWLKIAKREVFLSGYISYSSSDYNNSQHLNYQWDGFGYLPLSILAKGDDGKNYILTLQSINVQVFDPNQGSPPTRGGGK